MRNYAILCLLAFLSINVFSQRVIDEKKDVQVVKYPLIPMNGVNTYSLDYKPVKEDMTGDKLQYAPDKYYTAGVLALQGYSYNAETPDVTISLVVNPVDFPALTIEDISGRNDSPDFRAICKTVPSWDIQIRGKFTKDLKLSDFKDTVEVMFPPRYDAFDVPTEAVPSAEIIEKTLEVKEEEILDRLKEALYHELMLTVREVVKSQLSFSKKIQEVEIEGFKSNRRHDYSAWNAPYNSGIEILKKINSGAIPSDLYVEYKSIFDFWDGEVEKGRSEPKEYKKELQVASNNLVNLLLLVNPKAIKDIYLEKCDNMFAGPRYNKNKEKIVADAKARWEAFEVSEHPYSDAFAVSPLGENCYNLVYSDKKGRNHEGVIQLSRVYGKRPAEACNSFEIYKKSIYDENLGQPRSRDKMDEKDISGYSLLGIQYKNLEFKDPTAITIGKNALFMEEMINGSASLYRMYESGEAGLLVEIESEEDFSVKKNVVSKDGDAELIFNYKRLAKMLDDNTDVAEKIKNGEYGNKPQKEASGLGKFIQEGKHHEVSEDVLVKIVNDYNQ